MLKKDIEVLRRLADKLPEFSRLQIQNERTQQWYLLKARNVNKPRYVIVEFH